MKWVVVWTIIVQLLMPSGQHEPKAVVNKVVFHTKQEAVEFIGDRKDMFIIEETGEIGQTTKEQTDSGPSYTIRDVGNDTQPRTMDSASISR